MWWFQQPVVVWLLVVLQNSWTAWSQLGINSSQKTVSVSQVSLDLCCQGLITYKLVNAWKCQKIKQTRFMDLVWIMLRERKKNKHVDCGVDLSWWMMPHILVRQAQVVCHHLHYFYHRGSLDNKAITYAHLLGMYLMNSWSAAIVASGVLQNHRNQQRLFRGVKQSGRNYTRHQ